MRFFYQQAAVDGNLSAAAAEVSEAAVVLEVHTRLKFCFIGLKRLVLMRVLFRWRPLEIQRRWRRRIRRYLTRKPGTYSHY